MDGPIWSWDAGALAAAIRRRDVSCAEAAESVLARIAAVNPALNALAEVLADDARAAALAADAEVARGAALGPLHGVPATVKVNVDMAGRATTNGVAALKGNIAAADSAPVANLRAAGAVLVGRTNTPAFSVRWFTDNDAHGRTLNPWDARVTPGGSSGGAGSAVAAGMGAIAQGNDYGGSIRHPAYACGVVGLRPGVGRVPAFNPSDAGGRSLTAQLMSVQGPLTRSVADARLGLAALMRPDARDPLFCPAPLDGPAPEAPVRVAMFSGGPGARVDAGVRAALVQAGKALEAAGYRVEEAAPPLFDEAAALWRTLVYNDMRRDLAQIERLADAATAFNIRHTVAGTQAMDADAYLAAMQRRFVIAHEWSVFLAACPVLLMPVSFERPFPVDADVRTPERLEEVIGAQAPLLATALLGLPGLSVPTGLVGGVPMGVQICAARFREDLCLGAGEAVERACGRLVPVL